MSNITGITVIFLVSATVNAYVNVNGNILTDILYVKIYLYFLNNWGLFEMYDFEKQ
jgi:hypothetical protein